MHNTKRTFVALGAILCIFLSFSVSYRYFFVHRWSAARRLEDSNWIATSGSWLDRQLCTWFGACGISHLNSAHWVTHAVIPGDLLSGNETSPDTHSFWLDGKENSEDWSEDERAMRIVPKYVLEHAPLVHLYSGEEYWPCDIAEHLHHTRPYFNDEPIGDEKTHLNLSNLDMLREWSRDAFLRSNDNVENQPNWLMGKSNIPSHSRHTPHPDGSEKILSRRDMVSIADEDETMNTIDTSKVFDKLLSESDSDSAIVPVEISDSGQPRDATTESDIIAQTEQQTIHGQRPLNLNTDETPQSNPQKPLQPSRQGGRSGAPVIMITVDKGDGILDAFYFYFYSFNLGNKVLNIRFGNHVGDWEHNAIRFIHGVPKAMFFSQHASGAAYTWDAVEKIDKRVSCHSQYQSPPPLPHHAHAWFPTIIANKHSPQTARRLLRKGLPRNLPHPGPPQIHPPLGPPLRRDRPRAPLGPRPQPAVLHVRPRAGPSAQLRAEPKGARGLVLLHGPLGR